MGLNPVRSAGDTVTASPSLRAEVPELPRVHLLGTESGVLTPAAGNPSFCGYTCFTNVSCPKVFMVIELLASCGGTVILLRL